MNTSYSALIVSAQDGVYLPLAECLQGDLVHTLRARTCREARSLLQQCTPRVLFTDTSLPDGSWTDVLNLATGQSGNIPVILVSRFDDMELYLQAIERGAFDFMSLPLSPSDVAFIFQHASMANLQSPANARRAAAASA
ncbi:MAG: response regulator [Terriglobia bacterium]